MPAFLALLAIALMLGHQHVPNAPGNLGSLLETFLPWLGLSIPVLAAAAAFRRSATAAIAIALTTAVWLGLFGHLLLPGKGGGPHDLRVLTHNVGASNPDPDGTAAILLQAEPDIIALQELTDADLAAFDRLLSRRYPHQIDSGTVALWSRHPYAAAAGVAATGPVLTATVGVLGDRRRAGATSRCIDLRARRPCAGAR